jgi:hypothetical protein
MSIPVNGLKKIDRKAKIESRPSSKLAMGRAKATVTHRGIIEQVSEGISPRRRPAAAVENNEKSEDTTTAVTISAACLRTTCIKFSFGVR